MKRSQVKFERWNSREESSWPFQVFKRYGQEFDRLFWSHVSASKYVYSKLGESSAEWDDNVEKHFAISKQAAEFYVDLKDWSKAFNKFDNWVNLNSLVALTSNLETIMASVITLALQSDPGVLFGAPRVIDGVSILKHGDVNLFNFDEHIVLCTKGDWNSRAVAYEKIFGRIPEVILDNLSGLEAIRNLRNKVGHAFGRDIEEARKHGVREILPMEPLSRTRTLKYQRLIWRVAKSIDIHLLSTHIGEYQAVYFYHRLYPELRKDIHPSERAIAFKKAIGRFGALLPGKVFCKGLVAYYENL